MAWYYILAYGAVLLAVGFYMWRRGFIDGYIEARLEIWGELDDDDIEVDEGLTLMAETKAHEEEDLKEGLQQEPFDNPELDKPKWLYEEDGTLVNGQYHPYSEVER